SAQLRRGGAALQHGTLRLRADAGMSTGPLHTEPEQAAAPASLESLCGRVVAFEEAADALACGLAEAFAAQMLAGDVSARELQRAVELEASRYRCDGWTFVR